MILQDGILLSELLQKQPVIHGFTTRSRCNLGFGKNPKDADVIANRKKLFKELDLQSRIHVQPKQVHSDRSYDASEFVPGIEADAVFSRSPNHLLSILTADCVPILLYHPNGLVAAIHAGWRGLYYEIIPKALKKFSLHPMAAIGPAIGPCCYEISQSMAADFQQKFGSEVIVRGKLDEERPHLDLPRVAMLQLKQAGVQEMEACHFCTFCHPDLFFSYRRDGSTGRMMSFIGLQTG